MKERDPSELNAADARAFLEEARLATAADRRRRLIAAAVYFAIAAYECASERARSKAAKKQIHADAVRLLPHYRLLHDVRIHNFHRLPLPAADGTLLVAWGGPSVAHPGEAPASLFASDQRVGGTGRPVSMRPRGAAMDLHDRDRDVWVTDELALERYLDGMPAFLESVRARLTAP